MASRKIKQNQYGNWCGYTGRVRSYEFGNDEVSAAYWLLTGEVDFYAGYGDEWFQKCKEALNQL